MSEPSHPDLWAVVAPVCAAASLGTLTAILVAVRQINPVFRLDFDLLSLSAGLVTGVAGWSLGRGLWRLGRSGAAPGTNTTERDLRLRVVWGLVALGVLTVAGFALAAAGIPDTRRRDMIAGAVLALLVIGSVGFILMKLAKLFGRPDDPEGGPS